MIVKRKLIRNTKNSRSIMIPSAWIEHHQIKGHKIEYVYLEMNENGSILLTPIIEKK